MKKLVLMVACASLLCGCMNTQKADMSAEHNEKYENYMELLIDNSKQVTAQYPFEFDFDMLESNGRYSYTVSISKPRVAMYGIQMVAVDIESISETQVAPSIGIFEEGTFNMIPNQIDPAKGFYEGVAINGVTDKRAFVLNCLVYYKDKNQNDNYVYYIINANYDDFIISEEVEADE